MLEIHEMITSLVAEGHAVVLSSHPVGRGRDGPVTPSPSSIGARSSDGAPSPACWRARHSNCRSTAPPPIRAGALLAGTQWGPGVAIGPDGLRVGLAAGTEHQVVAEVNRLLVEGASRSTGSRRSTPRSSENRGHHPIGGGP